MSAPRSLSEINNAAHDCLVELMADYSKSLEALQNDPSNAFSRRTFVRVTLSVIEGWLSVLRAKAVSLSVTGVGIEVTAVYFLGDHGQPWLSSHDPCAAKQFVA